jgi:hypothetical protein
MVLLIDTMAVVVPALILKLMLLNTFFTFSGAVGYLKDTFSKRIPSLTSKTETQLS